MLAYDFEYDGVRLSDIGYTLCNFDGEDLQTVTNGSEIEFNTVSTFHGAKYERASSEYGEYLTATFQICKIQCDKEGLDISIHEFRHLMRWLNRKQFHKFKLVSDEMIGIYYEGSFNLSRIETEDKIVGVELELTTNRPYGLMEPREIWIDAIGEPFAVYSADDNTFTFYRDVLPKVGGTYKGKAVTNLYTGLKNTGMSIPEWSDTRSSVKKVVFDESFATCRPLSLYGWFYAFLNCTEFVGLENLDTSMATTMYYMFFECWSTDTIDVSNFDTSKVTTFNGMFFSCRLITSLDISSFDTSNATNMASMFRDCLALKELDVSTFHTSSVTNMSNMFNNCQSIVTIYSHNRNFVVDQVTSSSGMFTDCSKLVGGKGTKYSSSKVDASMAHTDLASDPGYFTYIPIEGSIINTLSVGYPFAVFSKDDGSLTFYFGNVPEVNETFNGKVVSNVYTSFIDETYTSTTIPWATHKTPCKRIIFDSTFYYVRPNNCDNWFNTFSYVTEVDLSGLNTSATESLERMFYLCTRLEEIDISGMDTSKLTNCERMFGSCSALVTIYSNDSVFNIDTDYVDSSDMFITCPALVGGNGTKFSSAITDGSMAHIDTKDDPGYFTSYKEHRLYDGTEYIIRDFSDEEGFIYPLLEITIYEEGTLTIYNDIEDRATIIRNCTVGEMITMDSPVITSNRKSHQLQNDFNWVFPRIANRMYERDNKLTITLPCTIKLIYSPVAKVGL